MSDAQHFETAEYKDKHDSIPDATEGGACLNGRCHSSYDKVTCSYRFQGMKAAENYADIYNAADIEPIYHLGSRDIRTRVVAAINNADVRRNLAINGEYDDVIGAVEEKSDKLPVRKDQEVQKRFREDKYVMKKKYWFVNFTIGSVPYSNQVHHVLNHSSLRKGIQEFKNISDVIAQGLLDAKYNINHHLNAVILPTQDKYSKITGLPVHGGHPNYNKHVLRQVKRALRGYKKLDKKAEDEDHPSPDPRAVKGQLVKISYKWYGKVMDTVPKNKNNEESLIKVDQIR